MTTIELLLIIFVALALAFSITCFITLIITIVEVKDTRTSIKTLINMTNDDIISRFKIVNDTTESCTSKIIDCFNRLFNRVFNKIDDLKEIVIEFKSQVEEGNNTIKSLEDEKKNLNHHAAELSEQLGDAYTEIQRLKDEMKTIEDDRDETHKKLEDTESYLKNFQAVLEKESARLEELYKEKLKKAEDELAELGETNGKLITQLADASHDYEKLRMEFDAYIRNVQDELLKRAYSNVTNEPGTFQKIQK